MLNLLLFSEPAYFLRRPEDTVSVAGSDVTLSCEVSQDCCRGQTFFSRKNKRKIVRIRSMRFTMSRGRKDNFWTKCL